MQLGSATTGAGYGYGFSRKLAEPTETLMPCMIILQSGVCAGPSSNSEVYKMTIAFVQHFIERIVHPPRCIRLRTSQLGRAHA